MQDIPAQNVKTDDEVATEILASLHDDLENLMVEHKYVTKERLTEVLATYFPESAEAITSRPLLVVNA